MTTTPQAYFDRNRQTVQSLNASERSYSAGKQTFRYTDQKRSDFLTDAEWETAAKQDLEAYLTQASNARVADGKLDATELLWATGIHATFWKNLMDMEGLSHLQVDNIADVLTDVDDDQDGHLSYSEKSDFVRLMVEEYQEDTLRIDLNSTSEELLDDMNNMSQSEREDADTVFGVQEGEFTDTKLKDAAKAYITAAAKSGRGGDDDRLNVAELMTAFGVSEQAVQYLTDRFKDKHNLDLTRIDDAARALVILDEGTDGFMDGMLFKDTKQHIERLAERYVNNRSEQDCDCEDDRVTENRSRSDRARRDRHRHEDEHDCDTHHEGRGRRHEHGCDSHEHQPCETKEKTPWQKALQVGSFLLQAFVVGSLVKGYGEQYHAMQQRQQALMTASTAQGAPQTSLQTPLRQPG